MEYSFIKYDENEGVAWIRIDRPESLNSLNIDVMRELDQAFRHAEKDPNIKVTVLTGEGDKAFVSGGDIKNMDAQTAVQLLNEQVEGQEIIRHIEESTKPVIAAINGYAFGGGTELALACDIRIASQKAKFGLPEITLGIMPGYGGTQRLPRLVGPSKAKELMMTGDFISAEEALAVGMVNKVVPHEQLQSEVMKFAKKLCERPPIALQMIKEAVNYGMQMDLTSAIRMEARIFNILFNTEDKAEGLRAFIEKRKPTFSGK
jgi:enoyl-CoA hydratase